MHASLGLLKCKLWKINVSTGEAVVNPSGKVSHNWGATAMKVPSLFVLNLVCGTVRKQHSAGRSVLAGHLAWSSGALCDGDG